jgi:tetratricopeptide (TPR) repeat protein
LGESSTNYLIKGNYDKAISLAKKNLKLRAIIFGKRSYFTSEIYRSLADSYYEQGDFNNAIKYAQKLYSNRPKKNNFANTPLDFLYVIYSPAPLVSAYIETKDYGAAEQIMKEFQPYDKIEEAYATLILARIYLLQGKYMQTKALLEKANSLGVDNHDFVVFSKELEVKYYIATNNYNASLKSFEDFENLTKSKGYCLSVEVYKDLAEFNLKLKNREEAEKFNSIYIEKSKKLCNRLIS